MAHHLSISESEIDRIKELYSKELRDDVHNPIKVCMKLIFESAIAKNNDQRSRLSSDLSRFLTDSDGVLNLFLAVIDFDTSSQKETTHNQRFLALSNIIASLPKLSLPAEDYVNSITRQLVKFLACDDSRYSCLASTIVKSMIESPHSHEGQVEKLLLDILDHAFTSRNSELKVEHAVIVIENLINNNFKTRVLLSTFSNLFHIHLQLHKRFKLKSKVEYCLTQLLMHLEPGLACCLLEKELLYPSKRQYNYTLGLEIDQDVCIIPGSPKEISESDKISIIFELLETCGSDELVLEFFFHFQETMWTQESQLNREFCAKLINPLLKEAVEESSTQFDIATLISKNMDRCSDLILRTLVNYVSFLKAKSALNEFNVFHKLVAPSVSSCLNILEVLTSLTPNVDPLFTECGPILENIKNCLELLQSGKDKSIVQMHDDVSSLLSRLSEGKRAEAVELSDSSLNDSTSSSDIKQLVQQLNDPLQPVRVHALVQLKLLVISNDKLVISQIARLFGLVSSCLADEEPYVFLAAINLIAEMGVRRTDELLKDLCSLYVDSSLALQHRMNVGEVIVRISRQLNQTGPHYSKTIMGCFMRSWVDDDELMRISSLANIGEVCRTLGDSLGNYMVDILNHLAFVLENDYVEVKSAAIDLLRNTLMGLEGFRVESIQRELKTIYGLLKKVKQRSLDTSLCLQVDLALEELDRIARELLCPMNANKRPVKEIKVLSLLD